MLGLEVGAYGESGVGGPVLIDGYLLGFCLVLGEQLFLLGRCSPLGLGGLQVGGPRRRHRLEGELERVMDEIRRADGKLNNQGFVSKAPKKLVDEERAKLNKYIEMREKLFKQIESL